MYIVDMVAGYTFKQLAFDILEKTQRPMTPVEIWQEAVNDGRAEKVGSSGNTPWLSIGSQLYTDMIKSPENTEFCKVSRGKLGLKKYEHNYAKDMGTDPNEETGDSSGENSNSGKRKKSPFDERDLHPLLVAFVFAKDHFHANTKTIYHETDEGESKGKGKRGYNKWVHPDIVGVHFPFEDYGKETRNLISNVEDTAIILYSFEMKKEVTRGDLRKYFFQAVSNSSWANEGYIVALDYVESNGGELIEEMRILNNAFGIGFIELNPEHVDQSEILLPAKYNPQIDWNMVDKLVEANPDFHKFVESINDDIRGSKIHNLNNYDEVLKEEDMTKYVTEHKIKKKSN